MKSPAPVPDAAAAPGTGGRALRFAAVGASGVAVNLGVLHLLAGVLGVREILSSAVAIEASILWNFLLHDAVTFRDRRRASQAGPLGRLLRYHAVSAVGALVQLGTFLLAALALSRAAGQTELGTLRYPAQATGIAAAFVWSFGGSMRFAWAPGTEGGREPLALAALVPRALFALLLVLHVLPIWLVRWFPTQDGPLHVENVLALLQRSGSPLLQHWYLTNLGAQPNWLTQAVFAALLPALSPAVAEKVILTGYTVLFPLAFRALTPRGTRGWWAALLAFPFVHAFPFHMGFWNYTWGAALALLTAGFFLRTRGRLGPGRWAILAGLSVLLYLAHLVALASAALVMGGALGWRCGLALRRARGQPARRARVARGYLRRGLGLVAATGPGLALALAWIAAHREHTASRIPFLELVAKLGLGYALVSIDRRELYLSAILMLAIFVAVVHLLLARAGRGGRRHAHDGWLAVAAAFVLLYFAVPDVVAAGAHVSDRFAWFALLAIAAWIGSGSAPMTSLRRVAVAFVVLAVAALGVRFQKQRELSDLLEEYVSAKQVVDAGSLILPLALSPHGPRDDDGFRLGYRVKPFLHAAGWIVAERGGVDLANSQANTDQCPVRFRPDRNPFRDIAGSLGRMEGMPPCVDLEAAARAPAGYVLVWGATREELRTPCGGALEMALGERYEPVFLSAPRGLIQVWRPLRQGSTRSVAARRPVPAIASP
jgi:putative flippase GtrA